MWTFFALSPRAMVSLSGTLHSRLEGSVYHTYFRNEVNQSNVDAETSQVRMLQERNELSAVVLICDAYQSAKVNVVDGMTVRKACIRENHEPFMIADVPTADLIIVALSTLNWPVGFTIA